MRRSILMIVTPLVAVLGCKEEPGNPPQGKDACATPGNICVFTGVPGSPQFSAEGIPASQAYTYLPQDVAFGPDGTFYMADFNNHRIRMVDEEGLIWTVSGTGMLGDGPEGDARLAAWNHPTNLGFNPLEPDILYVAAWHNSRINAIDLEAGTLDWYAGTGGRQFGGDGGPAAEAILDLPSSIAFDSIGRMFISDQANQLIRMIDVDGTITTVAGQQRNPGYSGDGGDALDAQFHAAVGQAADPSSRLTVFEDNVYLADTDNHVIRILDTSSWKVDTIAGMYVPSSNPDSTSGEPGYGGDGSDALDARFSGPRDVAFGPDGEMYVADTGNSCVRVVYPDGIIETFAGLCGTGGFGGDEGPALDALLDRPYGLAVSSDGYLYIADTHNHVVRRVAL